MDGDASGFIDDYHVVVFVEDGYGEGCYGRFMAMEGMGDNVAVFDYVLSSNWFAVYDDNSSLYGFFLVLSLLVDNLI